MKRKTMIAAAIAAAFSSHAQADHTPVKDIFTNVTQQTSVNGLARGKDVSTNVFTYNEFQLSGRVPGQTSTVTGNSSAGGSAEGSGNSGGGSFSSSTTTRGTIDYFEVPGFKIDRKSASASGSASASASEGGRSDSFSSTSTTVETRR